MKLKPLLIAVVVLGIAAGIGYYMNQSGRKPRGEDARIGKILLTYDELQNVGQVTVEKPKVDEKVILTVNSKGKWVLPEYFDMPIDFTKLQTLINQFQEGKVVRLANSNPKMFSRFELDSGKIEISDISGNALWTIKLGKQGTNGGTYVQFGEEEKVYLADISSYLDANQKNWPNKKLLPFAQEDVKSITIPIRDGSPSIIVSRVNKGDPFTGENLFEKETIKESGVNGIITAFAGSRFTDVSESNHVDVTDAMQNSLVLKFELFRGDTYTCLIGRRPAKPKIQNDLLDEDVETESEEPEMEPAGPVYMAISSSLAEDYINRLMEKLIPKYSDYLYNRIPENRAALVDYNMEAATPPITNSPAILNTVSSDPPIIQEKVKEIIDPVSGQNEKEAEHTPHSPQTGTTNSATEVGLEEESREETENSESPTD